MTLVKLRRGSSTKYENNISSAINSWIDIQDLYNDSYKIGEEYTKLEKTLYKEMSNLQQRSDSNTDNDV